MALLETLVTKLTLDGKDFQEGLSKAGGDVSGFVSKVGGIAGGAALAGTAALATGIAVVGKTAFDVGMQYDEALDNIIKGTGASGEALDAMGQSVRNLNKSTAGLGHEMGDIGSVLAEVNTRTGATGQELEDMTGQILKFSRVTGADGVKATRDITRLMGDWGKGIDDVTGLLDNIHGAGQNFGISTEALMQKLVQFGAPLRQMGFGLEESIALFGKWEKEGVNTETVLSSLRIAAGNFAEAGVPLRDGLLQSMEAIKGATTESEALTLAMETFGAKAGPDMAAAIREGRFELDEAIAAMQNTGGSLDDAAERTLDFNDRWEVSMRKMTDALIPLGEKIMELADKIMPAVVAAIDGLVAIITPLVDWIVSAVDTTVTFIETNEDLKKVFDTVSKAIDGIVKWFKGFGKTVDDQTKGPLAFLKSWVDENMPAIQKIFENVLGAIQGFWDKWGGTIMAVVGAVAGFFYNMWNTQFQTVFLLLGAAIKALSGDWEGAGQDIQEILDTWYNFISGTFNDIISGIQKWFSDVDWGGIGRNILQGIADGLRANVDRVLAPIRDISNQVMGGFQGFWNMHSPSRLAADKIGKPIVEGIGLGLEDTAGLGKMLDASLGVDFGSFTPSPRSVTNNSPVVHLQQVFNGAVESQVVRRAARDGLLEGLRAAGAA